MRIETGARSVCAETFLLVGTMGFVLRCEMPVDLVIVAELLGATHEFVFEGRKVSVSLSQKFYFKDDEKSDIAHEKIARCVAWRGNQCLDISVNIIFVTVELQKNDGIIVDEAVVKSEESANALFWERNSQEDFQKAGRTISNIASRAFDFWCRILRWKTSCHLFGSPVVGYDAHPSWRYIASADPLKYVASLNDIIVLTKLPAVSVEAWSTVQEALGTGLQPPIWIDFWHEAMRRRSAGDLRGAILDGAVSLESFLRHRLLQALDPLPEEDAAIRKRIENWNMTDILSNLGKVSTLRALEIGADTTTRMRKTFDTRNSMMHGRQVDLDEEMVGQTLRMVKSLVQA
jgi:hypothetical protein